MASRLFSTRLNDGLINKIQNQFPEFGTAQRGGDGNSKELRKLIEQGLETDPEQARQHELAEMGQQLRDVQNELKSIRQNFSTVLQIILRNAGKFDPADVEATIEKLKKGGKIV